jgi:SOS response associated peptidase (SRAP)
LRLPGSRKHKTDSRPQKWDLVGGQGWHVVHSGAPARSFPAHAGSAHVPGCLPNAPLFAPVDGFFEWKAIKGQKAKQPYAIAMRDGAPFGLAGIWENWKAPASGEWVRTFAIITTDANELVADIHDWMPLILAPADYARWLGEDPDPRDLMRPFPAAPMRMWSISTRVNKPENDDPSIVEPIRLETDAA